ncbi:LysR family transcriptional regulator [Sphingomonas faeni]|uniref:LysR family transcriptional regulator n=1 Tax=Sphingomonas faeni TaxID=185950 RepID=UPI0027D8B715|nr:LysR family transcriptional regulator [Sphingomonas faeni]
MRRGDFSDLAAFMAVADEGSFTRAAAKLGLSQSALSQSIRGLEERLGVRLLARTTRSVSPTEAGDRLLLGLRPAFDGINGELTALTALRDKPAGTIRITTFKHAAASVLWPALTRLMREHPDVHAEITVDDGLIDIVAGRYDAGIRIGEQVEKDMIAVRVGPDIRMAVVGAPSYFERRPAPQDPRGLREHDCINYRQTSSKGLYAWEFERNGVPIEVRVNGPVIVNDAEMMVMGAIDGLGLTYIFEDQVAADIAAGRLVRVLDDWCPPFPGYHLYYPSRRQLTPAFALLVDALRFRA